MKHPFLPIILFFLFFKVGFSQDIYYNYPFGVRTWNPNTCVTTGEFFFNNYGCNDIAFNSVGKLFGLAGVIQMNGSSISNIIEINPLTGDSALLAELDRRYLGLVCQGDSILYAAGDSLVSYNLNTKNLIHHGQLPEEANGDMIILDEQLVYNSVNNKLIQINIDDFSQNTTLFDYSSITPLRINGLVNIRTSCDSNKTYGVTEFYRDTANATVVDWYEIDIAAQQINRLCNTTGFLQFAGGMTSPSEFLSIPCSLTLDLDADDDTAMGIDFTADSLCNIFTSPVADNDVSIDFTGNLDSVTIQITGSLPDGMFEILEVGQLPINLSVTGSNSQQITLTNAGSATVDTFLIGIKNVFYKNIATSPTSGNRTLTIAAYGEGGLKSEEATAFLFLDKTPDPGLDRILDVCENENPIQLNDSINQAAIFQGAWLNGFSGLFDPSIHPSGNYEFVIFSDLNYCPFDTFNIDVMIRNAPLFSFPDTLHFCEGDSVILNFNGDPTGANFLWSDNSTADSLIVFASGNYNLMVENSFSCTFSDSFAVLETLPKSFDENMMRCYSDTIFFENLRIIRDTQICRTSVANNGCDSTYCLNAFFLPEIPITNNEDSLCVGDTIFFNGLKITDIGTFEVLLESFDGCDSSVKLTVLPAHSEPITIETSQNLCPDDSIRISVSDINNPIWQTGETTPSIWVSAPGTYFVEGTLPNGCKTSGTILIIEELPIIFSQTINPIGCDTSGGSILIEPNDNSDFFSVAFNSNIFQNQFFFDDLKEGFYPFSLQNNLTGCIISDTANIFQTSPESVDIVGPQIIDFGESAFLSADFSGLPAQIIWSPDPMSICEDSLCIQTNEIYELTTFHVTGIYNNGCIVSDSITLDVQISGEEGVFIPSGFSPNNDGINDFFTAYPDKRFTNIKGLQIFDRWGNLLFYKENIPIGEDSAGWDGKVSGQPAMQAVYVYLFEMEDINGEIKIFAGDVSILK